MLLHLTIIKLYRRRCTLASLYSNPKFNLNSSIFLRNCPQWLIHRLFRVYTNKKRCVMSHSLQTPFKIVIKRGTLSENWTALALVQLEVLPTIFKSEIGWCSVDWPFFHYHSGVLNSGVRIEHYINTFKTQAQSYTVNYPLIIELKMKNYTGFFFCYNRFIILWKPLAICHRFGGKLQPYGTILLSNGILLEIGF